MPTRKLSREELSRANALLALVRDQLARECGDDQELLWAMRRKVAKELVYDERGKPMHRRFLKLQKMASQAGACAQCGCALPEKGSVLDRIDAMLGYTAENTRLVCPDCNVRTQEERGYGG